MNKRMAVFLVLALVAIAFGLDSSPVAAANLTIQIAGRVTIELITSDADFRNTLSVISPTASIAATGCKLEPAVGLSGVLVLSEKISQHGCRVDLDADPATAGIQGFAANTMFEFGMCAQLNADPNCEFVWSSNPSNNSDNFDHVRTTTLSPGVYQLAWEDKENGGDMDFNDLIVVVRVASDADGDGLWDDWEQSGLDTNGDGMVDFTLPGANPNRKDIYLEIDYMDCAVAGGDCPTGDTHSHRPKMAAYNAVIAAFANSPVNNPDGSTGITLHVEIDDAIAHQNFLALGCGFGNSFDAVKADPAIFGPTNPRRFTHHYTIFAHRQAATTGSSGCGEVPGNDFIVTLGDWNAICIGPGTNGVLNTTPAPDDVTSGIFILPGPNLVCNTTRAGDDVQFVANGISPPNDLDGDGLGDRTVGTVQEQAGTLMHEFGHNLNLSHGGGDGVNFKPNYLSIMNYWFQTFGIPPTDPDGTGPLAARVDYSNDVLPSCVGPGANGVLNTTTPALDDTVSGNFVRSGPDRTCNTTAVPDDVQFVPNGSTAALVENNLNETTGMGDGTDNTRYFCPTGARNVSPGIGAIDWDCDSDGGTETNVSADINGGFNDTNGNGIQDPGEPLLGPLNGFEDWNNLKYDFQSTGDFEDGVHDSTTTLVEIDYATHLQIPVSVEIDIKPGGDPNSIRCTNQNEVITVAILTTDDFDALSVDHTTVSFAGATEIHVDNNGNPRRHERDVDGDGDLDLVFHFRLGDTSLTCDSTEGTLMGKILSGSAIVGTDSIRMVP